MAEPLIREPVRFPATTRRRRRLDERLWLLLPFMVPITTKAILGLPPNSRIRRWLIRYWVRRSYEIVNRRDFELALLGQDPETVIVWPDDPGVAIPADLVGQRFVGHDGFREVWEVWLEAFGDLRLEPEEVSDLGDGRLLIGIRSVGHGAASGVLVDNRSFTLYTFENRKVARQDWFADRDEAERAAGLS